METCSRPHLSRGYCKPHYRRWRDYGDPAAGKPLPEDQEQLPDGYKRCAKCGEVKTLGEFSPSKAGFRGKASYCKPCNCEKAKRLNRTPKDQRAKPGAPRSAARIDRSPGSGNELNPRKKYEYPGDHVLIESMGRLGTFADVAAEVGVPWSCLKDWLNDRPQVRAAMEAVRPHRSEEEVLAERRRKSREYQRQVRAADPDKARALRREQMRKYGPEYRRRWNTYNRLRREHNGGPMTQDAIDYLEIIQRDPCVYCGAPMEHGDHIEPISRGGDNSWDNFAATCATCNMRKQSSRVLFFLIQRDRERVM